MQILSSFQATLQSSIEPWLLFIAQDPMLRAVQISMLLLGSLAIFLVFFATRDILLRTNSFIYMFFCILLVAVVPGIGFFIYLLIRPARTTKERELERMVREIYEMRSPAPKQNRVKKEVKVP